MTAQQVIIYLALALVGFVYVRRWLLARGLKHYSPVTVADLMKGSNSQVLLDVRTAAERQRQHIKGSIHIPLHELGHRMGELERHKANEVICYCQSGNRSVSAAVRLKKFGFTVANMKGGIAEWNPSGLR
jgi:rhodanese-related sulfurtransferase